MQWTAPCLNTARSAKVGRIKEKRIAAQISVGAGPQHQSVMIARNQKPSTTSRSKFLQGRQNGSLDVRSGLRPVQQITSNQHRIDVFRLSQLWQTAKLA